MQRFFVLSNNKNPLMPRQPARARAFLREGKSVVYWQFPFIITLKDRESKDLQPIHLKVDPDSKASGIALAGQFKGGKKAIFRATPSPRVHTIKSALDSCRILGLSRKGWKICYRAPRFLNRTKPKGWLPTFFISRVGNIKKFAQELRRFYSVSGIAAETQHFDTKKRQNLEMSSVAYQQGTLLRYEVRDYLLETFVGACAFCNAQNTPPEVELIDPRSRDGTRRMSNLTLPRQPCNAKKASLSIKIFLKNNPQKLKKISGETKISLKSTAIVNATSYAIGEASKKVSFWSSERTKFNRCSQYYLKDPWIDSVCVRESGKSVLIGKDHKPLLIKPKSHGSRRKCLTDQYSFLRTPQKGATRVNDFQIRDFVKAHAFKQKKVPFTAVV